MIIIKDCKVADILHQNNAKLIVEYSAESSIKGMPPTSAQLSTYGQLEFAGALHCIGAYNEDMMIGFASILISVLPHYGVATAIVESIFVSNESRKTGAGTKLFKAVESYAKNKGACGLLVSAPTGGSLAKMMEHSRSGFAHTNQVFFKAISHE